MDLSASAAVAALIHYKYIIILPLAIAEGPILGIICGFLVKLSYLNFLWAYLILMAGDLIGDVVWYNIGRHGASRFVNRFGHYFKLDKAAMAIVEEKFKKHQNKTLLISKMTNGFGFALVTLVVAGMLKVDFKKYMIINVIGGFVWIGFLMVVGYFFGHLYTAIDHAFRLAFLVGLAVIILAFLYGFQSAVRSAFKKGKI